MTAESPFGPVADWATDYDLFDGVRDRPDPIWDELRERARSPTPSAAAARGCRSTTRTSRAVAHDTEHFSSRNVGVSRPGRRRRAPKC